MQSVIDLGSGQARGADQLEEAALRLRSGHGGRVGGLGDGPERSRTAVSGIAGEEGVEPVTSEKTEDLSLLDGAGEVAAADDGGQIEQRAARGGDRDPMVRRGVGGAEPAGAMDGDPVAAPPAPPARGHLDGAAKLRTDAPQLGREAMAQQRAVAGSESGRHEPRQRAVDRPDEVPAAVHAPQPAPRDEPRDLRPAEPGADQLPGGERAMLAPRALPEEAVRRHANLERPTERNERCPRTRPRRTRNEALAERNERCTRTRPRRTRNEALAERNERCTRTRPRRTRNEALAERNERCTPWWERIGARPHLPLTRRRSPRRAERRHRAGTEPAHPRNTSAPVQPTRATFSAWIRFCAAVRRARGSGASGNRSRYATSSRRIAAARTASSTAPWPGTTCWACS